MARVNVGIDPYYLTDQWLVAESVEITMITGGLKLNNYQIKGVIPENFKLGTGMLNFFKNKLTYLERRLEVVNDEMRIRGFKPGTSKENLQGFPTELYNDWTPNQTDTGILRERLIWKLDNKPEIWRHYGKSVVDINTFKEFVQKSPLFYV
jgi:hypothetical protein